MHGSQHAADGDGRCIDDLIAGWADQTPNAPALLAPGRPPLTYARLWEQLALVDDQLHAMGIGRDDRVAVALPNGPDAAVATLAAAVSAVAVPTDPSLTEAESTAWFSEVRASAVIVPGDRFGPARQSALRTGATVIGLSTNPNDPAGRFTLARVEGPTRAARTAKPPAPSDVALLLATSGTTGRPRRVPLTHANLTTRAAAKAAAFGLSTGDRCLGLTAVFHVYHVSHLLMTLASGGSLICPPAPDADATLRWLNEFRPTRMTAVPAMLRAIVMQAADQRTPPASSLRMIHSGASSLPPALLAQVEATLRAPVLEGYGLTETAAVLTGNPPPPAQRKVGSVGVATGCEIAVLDQMDRRQPPEGIGEVVVRGPSVMSGYDGDPAATAEAFTDDHWFRTGDLGYLDRDGYLYLTGRLKEQINRGGTKIAPAEVEAVLLAHPDVAAAAAFAIPDLRLGEDLGAAVVPRAGTTLNGRRLRKFAASQLSPSRTPRRVVVVDQLPTTRSGKPLRLGLADKLGLTGPPSLLAFPHSIYPSPANDAAPRTATEAAVAGVWRFLLKTDNISIHDDFFDLGGDSLLGAQLVAQLQVGLGAGVALADIFAAPTVAEQAARIDASRTPVGTTATTRAPKHHLVTLLAGSERPVFVIPGGRGTESNLFPLAKITRHIGSDRSYLAFVADDMDEREDADRWMAETAAAYVRQVRDHQPRGPHLLLGVCVGGVLALEMGRQLWAAGEEPQRIILLDTQCPSTDWVKGMLERRSRADGGRARGRRAAARRRVGWQSPRVRTLMQCIPRAYPGRVTLLANEAWLRHHPTLGWDATAFGEVEVRPLPGGHGTLLRTDPAALAAEVRVVLNALAASASQ